MHSINIVAKIQPHCTPYLNLSQTVCFRDRCLERCFSFCRWSLLLRLRERAEAKV